MSKNYHLRRKRHAKRVRTGSPARRDFVARPRTFEERFTAYRHKEGRPRVSGYFAVRHWIDRSVAALLFVPATILVFGLCSLIYLTSGRPVFYRQERVGRRGRVFRLWKLRTMRLDAEKGTGPVWCEIDDPRVTSLGRFLRVTHLDELPQVWNVLLGHMALIGPRPERPEIVDEIVDEVPGYMERLAVYPGITGWAQIHQGSDTRISDVRSKLRYDLRYLANANPLLDLQIMLKTVPHVLGVGSVRRPGIHVEPSSGMHAHCEMANADQNPDLDEFASEPNAA
jgi:lipopolysaccharide/colanic/teichoic acid biosynthesis glycosyltransferase